MFADTYKARRHDWKAKSGAQAPTSPVNRLSEMPRIPTEGPTRRLTRHTSSKSHLIRSDLDDEQAPNLNLPKMPKHALGMRQRTKDFLLDYVEESVAAKSTFWWVESDVFQATSGLIICFNAGVIGMQTDIQSSAWVYIDHALLAFFTFELCCRLLLYGLVYFKHEEDWVWNWFDLLIVTSGVCDQWLVPLLGGMHLLKTEKGGQMRVFMMLMRMLRLLRIVRLFRLVRMVRPLYELARGVFEALQSIFWVLVFLCMTLYAVAILCTRLIGDGHIIPEEFREEPAVQQVRQLFRTVQDSMFSLFGTMSSWSLLKFMPLFEDMPFLKPMFVIFYVYSAWALLAVMTGVVSENMIAIREQMLKEDEVREAARRSTITKILIEAFQAADKDDSGQLSRKEFDSLLKTPALVRKIEQNTHLNMQDMADLFDWMDHDGSQQVTIDEFMYGFRWVNEPLRSQTAIKLQRRLVEDVHHLQRSVSTCLEQRINEIHKHVVSPLKKMNAITEQLQTLEGLFSHLSRHLRNDASVMPTLAEVHDVDARLNRKMDMIIQRLKALEQKDVEEQMMERKVVAAQNTTAKPTR